MRFASGSRTAGFFAFAMLGSVASAGGFQVERVSVDSSGVEADNMSVLTEISADGRFVAFLSAASNLAANDVKDAYDLFVHDRSTGTTEQVNVDSNGIPGDLGVIRSTEVSRFSISADGRFVAFASVDTNLVPNDTNGVSDIFVRDRQNGTTERVSVDSSGVEADNWSRCASISADGSLVAFASIASNLVSGGASNCDIFVHDRSTGVTERVSVDSAGNQADDTCFDPAISADGRIVAFTSSATNLVPSDTNGFSDVFVRDRSTGITERVSISTAGAEGDFNSWQPSLSADGTVVTFMSGTTNLVSGDTNGNWDAFLRDRTTGVTERVSVDSAGGESDGWTDFVTISGDGQTVAFDNAGTNLVANDLNQCPDVFVHYRADGRTVRVSTKSTGGQADLRSDAPSISADGSVVAFTSEATNLITGDMNGCADVYVETHCARADWTNYGAGLAGTNGVPSITASGAPLLGKPITITLSNSYGQPTAGLLFFGLDRANLSTPYGGTLLVLPIVTIPLSFSFGASSYVGTIPRNYSIADGTLDLQAVEADPGAVKGVSFTAGLELVVGR